MSHTGSPPAIRVYDSGSRHGRHPVPRRTPSHSSTPAVPMPIPHAREAPPPPLPPPRYISGLDTGVHETPSPSWQVGSPRQNVGLAAGFASSRPGISLLGSLRHMDASSNDADALDAAGGRRHRGATVTIDTEMNDDASDEERMYSRRPSVASRRPHRIDTRLPHRLHSESQLGQIALETSSQAYDKQLLAKMSGPNSNAFGSRVGGGSFLSPTSQDHPPPPPQTSSKRSPRAQLKPLAMPPDRRYNSSIESPLTRWTSAPSSGISPGSTTTFRSPFDPAHPQIFPRRQNSASTSDAGEDTRSKRGSDDQGVFMDHDFGMEENGMRELNINERSPGGPDDFQLGSGAPLKRRALSPPVESLREDRLAGGNDPYHRRSTQMLSSRASPVSRFHAVPGSVSSVSSLGQKTASYASTNMSSWNHSVASSMTSYGDRLSPGAMSPSVEADCGPLSPYATSRSLNPSPRSSVSKTPHQRTFSETEPSQNQKMSTDSAPHSRQNSVSHSKIQGIYICECCPKKPKKFDSAQELRAHEQEKQYQCQYCPNRFKNKNEAERHQNSLHLRRHSWSCAALAGVHAAFHPSGQPPSATDICGYCGEEFPNPPNWDARNEHLNHVHKYGECNQGKKFFRADHFRQHLKHSHAGLSGKWTNMLENACMKDEPPPAVPAAIGQKERMGSLGSISSALSSPIGINGTAIPGVIDEVHEES